MFRRDFLSVMLATGCAPAIVRAESLMKIIVPSQEIIIPDVFWGQYHVYNMAKLTSHYTPAEMKIALRVELIASFKRKYGQYF